MKIGDGSNVLRAYVFLKDGMHSPPVTLPIDAEVIASFIVRTRNAPSVIFTNTGDNEKITTMFGFIDQCQDKEFLQHELLPVLIPMQQGDIEPQNIEPIHWGYDDDQFSGEDMREWLNKEFHVDL